MDPNRNSEAKALFFKLFRQHWDLGTGIEGPESRWTHRTFANAMGRAGIKSIDPGTVDDWLHGVRLPLRSRKDAILDVFFSRPPGGYPELDMEASRQDLDKAWNAAQSQLPNPRKNKDLTDNVVPLQDWDVIVNDYIQGLTELRLYQPRLTNDQRSFYLDASLRVDPAECESEGRHFLIGIRSVFLSVASSSYQPVVRTMIGDRTTSKHYQRKSGGVEIVGPRDDRECLEGDLLGDEYIAVMEPTAQGEEWVTVRLHSSSRNFMAFLIKDDPPIDEDIRNNVHISRASLEKDAIINILLNKALKMDGNIKRDGQGRPIIAEAKIRRRVKE